MENPCEAVADMGGITGPVVFTGSTSSPGAGGSSLLGLSNSPLGWTQPRLKYPSHLKPENVPGPRAAHSCNLIGSKLYVFGGWYVGIWDMLSMLIMQSVTAIPDSVTGMANLDSTISMFLMLRPMSGLFRGLLARPPQHVIITRHLSTAPAL